MIRNTHRTPKAHNVIGDITVLPGTKQDFFVGIYESVLPQPRLSLEFFPEQQSDVQTSLVRLDGRGEYSLMYHFINIGKAPYRVIIRAAWPDDV